MCTEGRVSNWPHLEQSDERYDLISVRIHSGDAERLNPPTEPGLHRHTGDRTGGDRTGAIALPLGCRPGPHCCSSEGMEVNSGL
jgi:hypothetical protein